MEITGDLEEADTVNNQLSSSELWILLSTP